jgi:hypothetical protein
LTFVVETKWVERPFLIEEQVNGHFCGVGAWRQYRSSLLLVGHAVIERHRTTDPSTVPLEPRRAGASLD